MQSEEEEEEEEEEEDEEEEEEEEAIVTLIEKDRFNIKLQRKEWFVHWADGEKKLSPIDNLRDDDGTENIHLLKYSIRKDMEENSTLQSKYNLESTTKN